MPPAKEILPSAILGTRATGSAALLQAFVINSKLINYFGFWAVTQLWPLETYKKNVWNENKQTYYLLNFMSKFNFVTQSALNLTAICSSSKFSTIPACRNPRLSKVDCIRGSTETSLEFASRRPPAV